MSANARRRHDEGFGSFDSLLDTMTNVVGFLVIILVVTQLGVQDALKRIRLGLPNVTPEQLAELQRAAAASEQELSLLKASGEERHRNETRDRDAVLALRQSIEKLHEHLKGRDVPNVDLDEVRKAIVELEKQVAERQAQVALTQEEIAKAKALLDKTPPRQAPPEKVVRLPNPRPALPNASCLWFTCRNGRVAYADTSALVGLALEGLQSARQQLVYREPGKLAGQGLQKWKGARGPEAGLTEPVIYDPEKLVAFFKQRDIGSRDHRLEVRVQGDPPVYENLFVMPRPDGGESVQQFRAATSRYQGMLRRIDPEQNYVRFLVWPDSFEAYIEARQILEKCKIPAGWTIHAEPEWHIAGDLGIKLYGEPPPAPPPPPQPQPATPPPPPPPPIVLD